MAARPRFEVREVGPRAFYIHDNVTELSYDFFFTHKGAQEAVDRRNASASPAEPRRHNFDETPREAADFDRAWFDRDYDTDED